MPQPIVNQPISLSISLSVKSLIDLGRRGQAVGVGLCNLNPSGCFDILERLCSSLYNMPFIRVHYTIEEVNAENIVRNYYLLDTPPLISHLVDTILFTGCGITFSAMSTIISLLTRQHGYKKIHCVYQISPPHHPECFLPIVESCNQSLRLFNEAGYGYHSLYSGILTDNLSNIGMPRYKLHYTTFDIPKECYGLIRHRHMKYFISSNSLASVLVRQHFEVFFSLVIQQGKECSIKPLKVIALGVKLKHRNLISRIAAKYSVSVDFCEGLIQYRLPKQNHFFKVLSSLGKKKGIISLDGTSTQSLIQALSFQTQTIVHNPNGCWSQFYEQLIHTVPSKYHLILSVFFGMSFNFELIKNELLNNHIFSILYSVIQESHQRFEAIVWANSPILTPSKTLGVFPETLTSKESIRDATLCLKEINLQEATAPNIVTSSIDSVSLKIDLNLQTCVNDILCSTTKETGLNSRTPNPKKELDSKGSSSRNVNRFFLPTYSNVTEDKKQTSVAKKSS